MNNKTYGDVIYEIRRRLGVSQTDFATLLGLDQSAISYYEGNEIRADLTIRRKLVQILQKHLQLTRDEYTKFLEDLLIK